VSVGAGEPAKVAPLPWPFAGDEEAHSILGGL
jgi:hypothetical protein